MVLPSEMLPDHPNYNVQDHLARVRRLFENYSLKTEEAWEKHTYGLMRKFVDLDKPPHQLLMCWKDAITALYKKNDYYIEYIHDLELPHYLHRMERAMATPGRLARADECIVDFFKNFTYALPNSAYAPIIDQDQTTLPLIDVMSYPIDSIGLSILELMDRQFEGEYLFPDLHRTIRNNAIRASGYDLDTYKGQTLTSIHDFKGSPIQTAVTYLHGTPLLDLFTEVVPFSIPLHTWKEHGFLFAKSGHGKSQTMRSIFADLIPQDCAIFMLDGNGALIENIDKIASIKDRLVILDPKDAPALNFFTMNGASREKQMELFFYLFKAIDQGLTERQATMVAYLVDLMQSIPGATLDTLRDVCESKTPLYPTEHLEPIVQDFFARQFYSKDALINQTKSQIAARLYTIGRNRTFSAMFNAPENKFDAYQCMQERKIVIVNTDRGTDPEYALGDQGSAVFGRYILAQCLAAAWKRPKNARHLALIMVDEAKTYLDDQSKKILSDARAFGVGLLLASQFPDQLDEGVRKEVINNTSVKIAGPAAYSVISQLNRDMRCDADFILNMKKKDYAWAEWACYVDNMTQSAVKLTVPFGVVEMLPTLDAASHTALRRQNRERMAATPKPATTNHSQHKEERRDTPQLKVSPPNTDSSPLEYDTDI